MVARSAPLSRAGVRASANGPGPLNIEKFQSKMSGLQRAAHRQLLSQGHGGVAPNQRLWIFFKGLEAVGRGPPWFGAARHTAVDADGSVIGVTLPDASFGLG